MKWIVVRDGWFYLLAPTLEKAKELEAAHEARRRGLNMKLLVPWLASEVPLNIALPLVLYGTHKVIVL